MCERSGSQIDVIDLQNRWQDFLATYCVRGYRPLVAVIMDEDGTVRVCCPFGRGDREAAKHVLWDAHRAVDEGDECELYVGADAVVEGGLS